MAKVKVGILYGGRSVEHEVSVKSARNVDKHIDKESFDVCLIGISKKGLWKLIPTIETDIEKGNTLELMLNPENPYFKIESGDKFKIDVIFSMLHGTDGEDGSIQGLLSTMDIPIVGSGVLGSSISMNKLVTKQLLLQAGLPVVKFIHYPFEEKNTIQFDTVKSKLGLPFMVKAVNLGSSIGISKIDKEVDFIGAIEHSFCYDDSILIETYIDGREIECAVLGGTPPKASSPGEIIIRKNHAFYTFDAKYVDPDAVIIDVPAKLSQSNTDRIKELATHVFQVLHCKDFARVDLFLDDNDRIYINEVNTIPGFTNSSMFPLMWQHHGLSFGSLITQLIHLSLHRFKQSERIKKDFKTT